MRNILLIVFGLLGVVSAAQSQDVVTDIDGNSYKTVKIGNQVWMAENLKVKHYRDGSSVDSYVYDNQESNADTYGRLYSSKAVAKSELAPEGWHIPTKEEWEELANYLGGLDKAGEKLKSNDFKALTGGMYDFTRVFQWFGKTACFTTATKGARGQVYVFIEKGNNELKIGHFHPDDAVSVRCIKD